LAGGAVATAMAIKVQTGVLGSLASPTAAVEIRNQRMNVSSASSSCVRMNALRSSSSSSSSINGNASQFLLLKVIREEERTRCSRGGNGQVRCTLAAQPETLRTPELKDYERPDSFGRFGIFGGKYVPETLMAALANLEEAYRSMANNAEFQVRLMSFFTSIFPVSAWFISF
jgi:hypothetical protein